jgi:acyl-CoA synthetase (AMP-forming)/AMP-acid ligase II
MEGYGYPPDIEAAAWDGWLATGDVGALDRDGGLRLFGRADESFKTTANYLVNPSAIADALTAHPGVRDAVVVPVPYRGGTSIAALAEVSGAIDAAEVRRHAERCLPPWLVPHFLGVAGRFPRLPDGKIDRQAAIRMLERQLVDGGR